MEGVSEFGMGSSIDLIHRDLKTETLIRCIS